MPTVVQFYRLCRHCADRQGSASTFEVVSGPECSICRGLMDRVGEMAGLATRKARGYDFGTFAVGVSVPDGVQEREDEIRSSLRLKGNETIKTQAGKLIAVEVSKKLGKRIDRGRPDLTLLADFGAMDILATSRPVYYHGRYTKPGRISQRRSYCQHCGGVGCGRCGRSGYERKPSVEALLRRKLSKISGSEKMTFTWLGSEDRQSRVFSPGRPFVVEVKNPKKRRLPARFGARFRGGRVSVSKGRVLPSKPIRLPSFRFVTKIKATSAIRLPPEALAKLQASFREATVRFDRPHSRPTEKTVHSLSARAKGKTLLIDAELDGGLPVKRLVSGELVSPSVSEVLKTEIGCRSFDICGVKEIGGFGFAEIARNKEKD